MDQKLHTLILTQYQRIDVDRLMYYNKPDMTPEDLPKDLTRLEVVMEPTHGKDLTTLLERFDSLVELHLVVVITNADTYDTPVITLPSSLDKFSMTYTGLRSYNQPIVRNVDLRGIAYPDKMDEVCFEVSYSNLDITIQHWHLPQELHKFKMRNLVNSPLPKVWPAGLVELSAQVEADRLTGGVQRVWPDLTLIPKDLTCKLVVLNDQDYCSDRYHIKDSRLVRTGCTCFPDSEDCS